MNTAPRPSIPLSNVWQSAWEASQSALESIRSSLSDTDTPSPRVLRVGQLDSELLDQELVHLLQEPLNGALTLVNSTLKARFEPELTLLLQTLLYKFSVWNLGASYGAKLQDLRYTCSSPGSPTPSGLPRRILLIHGTLTILVPYLHSRVKTHALSRAWPDAPSSDRRRKAWDALTTIESSYAMLGLLSFVAFLWNGRYRTIADRLLNMRLVPSSRLVKRDVSYEFMNRQMVWHAFTEFLLFLLPLVNPRRIRRTLINTLTSLIPPPLANKGKKALSAIKRGKYYTLPKDQCAICAENASFNLDLSNPANAFSAANLAPMAFGSGAESSTVVNEEEDDAQPPAYPLCTPYVASCGDLYCHYCISERMMRAADEDNGDPWECLRCGEQVREARRLEAQENFGSEMSGSMSEYEFSSDMDMEGSVGSYSGSGISDEY